MNKNEKNRQNSGITLISLVITIIVMLILVGVSINLAVNGGLFEYAGNAVGDTKNAIKQEQDLIDDIIENHIKTNVSGIKTYEEAQKTDGYLTEKAKYKTATIPAGYKIVNEGTEIEDGLVISDSNKNEFVWIPVEKAIITESKIKNLRKEYPETTSDAKAVAAYANDKKIYPMAVEVTEQDSEGKNVTNYKGILYSFSGKDQLTVTVHDWTSTSYREPALLEQYDPNNWTEMTATLYQDSYNKMVKSVAENGGFYVGRYEISSGTYSVNGDTITYAQSQSRKTAMVSTTWYDMYKYESNYAKYNESLGVTSEMIWGSQWDQMMIFVNGKNDGAEETAKFYVGETGNRKSSDESAETGANAVDQVANIFDLEGSRYEWTQEAEGSWLRHSRGGDYFYIGGYACMTHDRYPIFDDPRISSRLALYIK